MRGKHQSIFVILANFLRVLSDSEVRFSKINMKRIGTVDFQSILTILRHFQKFNVSTPASYLTPSISQWITGSWIMNHRFMIYHLSSNKSKLIRYAPKLI